MRWFLVMERGEVLNVTSADVLSVFVNVWITL